MKQPRSGRVSCLVAVCCLLAGCATAAAPGISGRWTPVNRFDPVPQEIPLSPAYVFYAAPMDRTLKAMLTRWALDSKMSLVYQHPSDFTLYAGVSQLRTGDLHQAVAALSALYAAQGVVVSVEGGSIVVRRAGSDVIAPASPDAAPATAREPSASRPTAGQP